MRQLDVERFACCNLLLHKGDGSIGDSKDIFGVGVLVPTSTTVLGVAVGGPVGCVGVGVGCSALHRTTPAAEIHSTNMTGRNDKNSLEFIFSLYV